MIATVTPEHAFRVVDRALPPDPDDVVYPRRMLLIGGGLMAGLLAAVFAGLARAALANWLSKPQPASN